MDPQTLVFIMMAVEGMTRRLLRDLSNMSQEQYDAFISKEEAEKILNDLWLKDYPPVGLDHREEL